MKRLNQQRTLFKAFSTGREAIPLLEEMQESIDQIATHPEWQQRFLSYWSQNSTGKRTGREGHDIVLMIRLVLAQGVLRKDYRELAALLRDSLGLRRYLEIEYVQPEGLPSFQTLADWMKALPPEFLEEVNLGLLALQQQEAQQRAAASRQELPEPAWRSDGTCVESNIHYPTDSSLLRDGLRWMYRWILRMREELEVRARMNSAEMCWEAGHRIYLEIVRLKGRAIRKDLKKKYRALIQHTERVVGHFEGHLKKAARLGVFEKMEDPLQYARFRGMQEEWGRLRPLLEKALEQAERRVLKGETLSSQDKLLSLWEEHSRVIVRGKIGRPVEFGHKVTLWENQDGMQLCGGIYKDGNPPESQVFPAELERLRKRGVRIASVSLDRGYWDRERLQTIEQTTGVKLYCPKKGKKDCERAAVESADLVEPCPFAKRALGCGVLGAAEQPAD
jgi:IS5 family transposase